jgi:hypothetical protein
MPTQFAAKNLESLCGCLTNTQTIMVHSAKAANSAVNTRNPTWTRDKRTMSPGADQHVCEATVLHDTARHIHPNLGYNNRNAAVVAAGMRDWDAATLSRRARCLTWLLPAIACVQCAAAMDQSRCIALKSKSSNRER